MKGEVERFNRNARKRLQMSHVEDGNWRNDLADYFSVYDSLDHLRGLLWQFFSSEDMCGIIFQNQLNPALLYEDIIYNDLRMKEKRKQYADDIKNSKLCS